MKVDVYGILACVNILKVLEMVHLTMDKEKQMQIMPIGVRCSWPTTLLLVPPSPIFLDGAASLSIK